MSFSLNDNGKIFGYASVFNIVDSFNDIIKPGAFSNISDVKLLWQHNIAQPIGKIINLVQDSYGLYMEAELMLSLKQAEEAYFLVKEGIISGLSIGYNILDCEYDFHNNYRIIKEVNLIEISLVTFPANNYAQITSVKSNISSSCSLKYQNL